MRAQRRDGPGGSFRSGGGRTPVFKNVPFIVVALLVPMAAVMALGWLSRDFQFFSMMSGAIFARPTAQPLGPVFPYFAHVFLHGGFTHLLINGLALLSFGAAAARPFGENWRGRLVFLAFFFACGAAGAAVNQAVEWGSASPMVGASTALSGCLAAAGFVAGGQAMMVRYAATWAGINIVIAVVSMTANIPIAWAGHMGGLAAGVMLYPVVLRLYLDRRLR